LGCDVDLMQFHLLVILSASTEQITDEGRVEYILLYQFNAQELVHVIDLQVSVEFKFGQ
jgi:hypothetical protein